MIISEEKHKLMIPVIKKRTGRIATGFVVVLLACVALPAAAQTIKLATVAPEGSAWMKDMRAGAKEIEERTEGRVNFKFYGGGVQGNDKQVLRKMRIGQLHGGTFTSSALGEFQKNAVLYAMPMMFSNLDEVQFARQHMDARLQNMLEEAGYANFGFAGGGFAHLMSNRPIANLDDMQGLKVWIPDGDRLAYGAAKALGISPVTMPLTDVLTGLQTELIDTIMGPPAGTIVLQWNTGVSHITELPLAYIFAMLVIDRKYFDRIQLPDQAIVREVMERVYRGFDQQGNEDNEKAFQALLDDGMQAVTPDQGQIPVWRDVVRKSNHELAHDGVVDAALLDQIECYIDAYREGKQANDCG
jgi:TRAP-type C4-dicarboxylate transport system substrate-binding protein